jgi:hypothetical protein
MCMRLLYIREVAQARNFCIYGKPVVAGDTEFATLGSSCVRKLVSQAVVQIDCPARMMAFARHA